MVKISVLVAVLMLSPDSYFSMADVTAFLTGCGAVVGLIIWIVRIARFQTTLKVKQDEHKEQIDEKFADMEKHNVDKFRAVHKRVDDKADNSKLGSMDKKLDLILEKIIK